MEKIGDDDDSKQVREKLKSETAIRCAKATLLLSSLRNSAADNTSQIQIEEKIKTERRKLQLMKKELVRKDRKLRRWIGVAVFFYFVAFPLLVLLLALGLL